MAENLLQYLPSRYKPENVNLKHKQSLTLQERVALFSTKAMGTMYTVYIVVLVVVGWMLWQSSTVQPFDPYPFAFLLFIVSSLQLPLMSLIMVGQNLLGRQTELRAEEEFKTTETIYKDIEKIFIHLDAQDRKMEEQLKILTKLKR